MSTVPTPAEGLTLTSAKTPDALQIRVDIVITEGTKGIQGQINALLLTELLRLTNGDKSRVAEILGVSLKTVYNRLDEEGKKAAA